ncbi:SMC-Scp complex subunit ScpB [Pseudoclavibacter sp. 13-3]|nr:SMC-Scp complex subunit ScpB [Pseudoclavibacter sp. 13-3]
MSESEDLVAPAALAQLPVRARLEAVLIAADHPIETVALAAAVEAPVHEVEQTLAELRADYDGPPVRGFDLRRIAGGWQLYVRAGYEPVVRRMIEDQAPPRLSQAALETLSVIAYKQPISRGQIASIRAVNVDSVVRTLLARGLIAEAYVDEQTQATFFETTNLLLSHLGIDSLDDLPPISDLLPEDPEDDDLS